MITTYTSKISNENKWKNKILVNSLLVLIFLCLFIIMFAIGYQTKYKDISVLPLSNGVNDYHIKEELNRLSQPLNQTIRTIRGIGLFFLGWYLFFSIRSIYLSFLSSSINLNNQIRYLSLFNFSGISTLYLFIYLLVSVDKQALKQYLYSWFDVDEYYLTHQYQKDSKYWLVLALVILSLPIVWFALFREKDLKEIANNIGYGTNLWFNSLQYFTVQTNLLCLISLIAYLIFPKWKLFKHNQVFILMGSYILIVCLVFNLAIIPFNVEKYQNQPYKIARTVVEHGINPVLYISSFIILMFKDKQKEINQYMITNNYGLIIPAVYGVYAIISPLACGETVYGFITNTNPQLISAKMNGNYATFLVLIAFGLLFSLFNWIFWLINKKIHQSINSKDI